MLGKRQLEQRGNSGLTWIERKQRSIRAHNIQKLVISRPSPAWSAKAMGSSPIGSKGCRPCHRPKMQKLPANLWVKGSTKGFEAFHGSLSFTSLIYFVGRPLTCHIHATFWWTFLMLLIWMNWWMNLKRWGWRCADVGHRRINTSVWAEMILLCVVILFHGFPQHHRVSPKIVLSWHSEAPKQKTCEHTDYISKSARGNSYAPPPPPPRRPWPPPLWDSCLETGDWVHQPLRWVVLYRPSIS